MSTINKEYKNYGEFRKLNLSSTIGRIKEGEIISFEKLMNGYILLRLENSVALLDKDYNYVLLNHFKKGTLSLSKRYLVLEGGIIKGLGGEHNKNLVFDLKTLQILFEFGDEYELSFIFNRLFILKNKKLVEYIVLNEKGENIFNTTLLGVLPFSDNILSIVFSSSSHNLYNVSKEEFLFKENFASVVDTTEDFFIIRTKSGKDIIINHDGKIICQQLFMRRKLKITSPISMDCYVCVKNSEGKFNFLNLETQKIVFKKWYFELDRSMQSWGTYGRLTRFSKKKIIYKK